MSFIAQHYSASLKFRNSDAPIPCTSVLLSNQGVKTIHEIRRDNLLEAIRLAGTQVALAERSGLSSAYMSQVARGLKDSKTGRPRTVGDDAARAIEKALDLPTGWMDNDRERIALSREAVEFGRYWDTLDADDRRKLVEIAGTVTGRPAPTMAVSFSDKEDAA